jgi:hypothetical protein
VEPWPTRMRALSGLKTIRKGYGLNTHKGRTEDAVYILPDILSE